MSKMLKFILPFLVLCSLWPALQGPLLLDDNIHLGPLIEWLSTRSDTFELIFNNQSGPFGRPVSILSFIANALTTGALIWPMKLTNLILHIITGLCFSSLLYRLFMRDGNFNKNAKIASITAAGVWLILPQHISTVFYLIQRMTLLATLFSVLACWLYVVAREQIDVGGKHRFPMLTGVAVLTGLSILSKESGLLIPLYCLVIELVYFPPSADKPRPQAIAWGFRLGVIYPCLIVAAYLTFNPDFVLAPYTDRAFTMQERLLTQVSVIADYFASTFVPMTASAGIFNDDFQITRVFSHHEAFIILAGACLIFAALLLHKKYPGFSAGIGLFFIGHLLESSIFSLEIYFAHRNYFPSMGLVLALWGLVAGAIHRHPDFADAFKKALPLAISGLFLTYAVISFGRAVLWSDNVSLLTHAQIHHPNSLRLRSELFLASIYAGRTDTALEQTNIALEKSNSSEKRGIQLWRILAYCYAQKPVPGNELEALYSIPADRITLATSTVLNYVSIAAEANACPGLDRRKLGLLVNEWATNTIQFPGSPLVWKTHLASARLLASSGDLKSGYTQAAWAFKDSGYNFDAGLLAYQLANSLEDDKAAQAIMARLNGNKDRYTKLQKLQLQTLQTQQARAEIEASVTQ